MGYYKNLLIDAQQGSKEAIKIIAQDFERKKQYELALKWYSDISDNASIKRIEELLKETK
jgi:hypothetical protein